MTIQRKSIALLSVLALSACGGGGTNVVTNATDAQQLLNRLDEVSNIIDRVRLLPFTQSAAVPTTGSIEYTGVIGGTLATPTGFGEAVSFIGDASMTADFATSTVSGTSSDFFGSTGGLDPKPVRYDGQLAIANGTFGGTNRSQISARVTGDLSDGINELEIDNTLTGEFYGTSPTAIGIRTNRFARGNVNGTRVVASYEIIVEQ